MTARIIDGKAAAARIRAAVAAASAQLRAARGISPGLVVVRVGEDPASKIYVTAKKKAAAEVGLDSREIHLPAEASEREVRDTVLSLNADRAVHGILVQLPLPQQISAHRIIGVIDSAKDVDGLTPVSAGNLFIGKAGLRPCTPAGVMRLIDETGVFLEGAHAVVVGRSNLVGKPMAIMLLQANATVTVCHSKSDVRKEVAHADVLVVAAGVAELVKGAWIKPGAVVIDVGMNRNADGKLVGDVEFAAAAERASWITPVPGGVGPVTIAMLLQNTLQAATASIGDGAPGHEAD
jgi:methylenetetrahydrofolate dehydrogenase (NADP+)/methenyltetrahydrofolate cyclohydrolase